MEWFKKWNTSDDTYGDSGMSTIKSSDEHLTINADGSGKDIKFQANGVEKASISSAGAFTSTTIDATKLTGDLPAISGANLTGVGVSGITSSADATAMTITSAERIGINHTTPEARLEIDGGSETGLFVRSTVAGEYPAIFQSASTGTVPIVDFRNSDGTSRLQILSNGRGLSQFTAKAWAKLDGTGTPGFYDSHNCSSITDNATGSYTVNFTNNTANNNYAALGNAGTTGNPQGLRTVNVYSYSTSGVSFGIAYVDGTGQDVPLINIAIFGD